MVGDKSVAARASEVAADLLPYLSVTLAPQFWRKESAKLWNCQPFAVGLESFLQEPLEMISSWQMKDGRLTRFWTGQVERYEYESPVMQPSPNIQSGYLPPMPDFESHSPFGGPAGFWLLPRDYYQNPE